MDRQRVDRILAIVDICDVVSRVDPAGYVAALDRFLQNVLSRSSLFAYKFFDSSVPPCSSESRVFRLLGNAAAAGLCFGSVEEDADRYKCFREALQRLVANREQQVTAGEANAEYIARALHEIQTDFSWDSFVFTTNELEEIPWPRTKPNLVLLFSSMPPSTDEFTRFLESSVKVSAERKEHERQLKLLEKALKSKQKRKVVSSTTREETSKLKQIEWLKPDEPSQPKQIEWIKPEEQDYSKSEEQELADVFYEVFDSLRLRFEAMKIHVCWVQGPDKGEAAWSFHKECLSRVKWSYTSLDTYVMSSFVIPRNLLMPCITTLSLPKGPHTSAQIKLDIADKDSRVMQFGVVSVRISALQPSAYVNEEKNPPLSLMAGWNKISISLAVVLPRKHLLPAALKKSEVYFLQQPTKRLKSKNSAETLFERLGPHQFYSEARDFHLLLAHISHLDAVGLVRVKLDGANGAKCLQGILEPYTIHSAILYTLEDLEDISVSSLLREDSIELLQEDPSSASELDLPGLIEDDESEKQKLKGSALNLAVLQKTSWDEAWTLVLRSLQMTSRLPEDYMTGGTKQTLKQWIRQVKKSLKLSLLEDITKWLGSKSSDNLGGVGTPTFDSTSRSEEISPDSEEVFPESEELTRESEERPRESEEFSLRSEGLNSTPQPIPEASQINSTQRSSISEADAASYISSLKEKLNSCLLCAEVDVQRHARKIVQDTLAAAERLSIHSVKELLLECPGKLSLKYRHGKYSSAQKVQEFILQVKLRLELLTAKRSGCDEFVEEITLLLQEVYWSLPGELFVEKEDIVDFSNRVVYTSYHNVIPEVVESIYRAMELKGFDEADPEAVVLVDSGTEESSKNLMKEPRLAIVQEPRRYFTGRSQKKRFTRRPKVRRRSPEPEWTSPSKCDFVPETPIQSSTPSFQECSISSPGSRKRLRYQ